MHGGKSMSGMATGTEVRDDGKSLDYKLGARRMRVSLLKVLEINYKSN